MNSKWEIFLDRMKNYYHWSNKIEVAKESVFHCAGYILRTRIVIPKVDNSLNIAENAKILNYDIVIKGSGNSIEFQSDCVANGNHVSLTMWDEGD
ncbi:hypothetical protein H6G81_03245 [Scytonema hofmannii FACHB-248]|uniref:Uncharacterized protein n=1 Tax=Scytonema hofmannii FACHB-248 TaxID=1842502 RepID=A0ABR8GLF0_9CYAN|nr:MULTISPECIES: hypothetical protein [Nostocales]MBD2603568.1 hypothetical protein [Scytonema hofmannii FACHB-248]